MKHLPVIGLLVGAALLAGCDSNGVGIPPLPTETADVRFIHAVPDAPDVDIASPISTLADDLEYKGVTPLRSFSAETLSVQIDGSVPGGSVTVVGPVDLELAAETTYSVIAAGTLEAIDALVVSAPQTTIAEGSVRAQLVHAAPRAPAVDVYVTAPEAPLAQEDPLGSFAFGESLDPVDVPAGDYQIRVTAAGDPEAVVFDSGTVALPPAAELLIVAVENAGPGDSPITLLVADDRGAFEILDAETPAEVRAIHASPDAPAVDIFVNDDFDEPLLADVPFGAASDYLEVEPGTYNVKVTPAGNIGVIAIDANLEFAAGTRYSVYATDVLASISPYVLVDDNRPVATEAKVRVVHLAPGAGAVDIYVTEPGGDITTLSPTFANVDFRDETGYVGLAGGEYEITVTPAGTKDAAIGPVDIVISDGGVYTAVARDAEGGGSPFGLILLDDFDN